MTKVRETAFSAVCISFSAVLLVLCMLCSAKLAAVNDVAAELSLKAEALEEENRLLYVSYEKSIDLESLEKYATEQLGMQRCSPGQIIYVEYTDR